MSAEVDIDAREFIRAAEALERSGWERTAGRVVATALRKSGNAVRRGVRKNVAPHRRTGKLARGIRQWVNGRGMDTVVVVKSTGPVAHLVAGGVKAHDIAPGKVMAMHGPGKAKPLVGFASVVRHPGYAGDPYFAKGVRDASGDINAALSQAAEQMVAALASRMSRR